MENNKKISFFSRMIFAITDFRIYPFVMKEKVTSAISYFLKLVLLLTLIIAIYVFNSASNVIDEISKNYNDIMPNFVLKNGVLSAENRMEYKFENGIIIVDTDCTIEELKTKSNTSVIGYNYHFLVSNNSADLYTDDILIAKIDFSQMTGEYTKAFVYENFIEILDTPEARICFFVVLYISIILFYIFLKVSSILSAMILVIIINLLFGNRLKFSDEFKIVAYVLTLPLILEMIAFITIGIISESVVLIYQFLVGVYVFYALRAVKLDKIILAATRSGILKKIVNDGVSEVEKETNLETTEKDKDENEKD